MMIEMSFRRDGHLLVMNVALYLALGSGQLRLQAADPQVQPLLDYIYLQHAEDRRRLREGVRLCLELAARPEFEGI